MVQERIFSNLELLVMEQQIKALMSRQREMKAFVRDEFKKIQLRMEKEIMDAQQEENTTTVQMFVSMIFELSKPIGIYYSVSKSLLNIQIYI